MAKTPLSLILAGMRRFLLSLMVAGTTLCAASSISSAQTDSSPPIRVETREVLIPVFVFNQTNTGQDSEILGLAAKDFHVFEDGNEQKVQNVTVERLQDWQVQDNASVHVEYSCTPRGTWVGPDIPISQFPFFTIRITQQSDLHLYLVSYLPPSSAEGSCHRVRVKVDHRPKPTVYARDEYCSNRDSISDPLSGTKFGAKIEGYANSAEEEKIPVSVQVVSLFDTSAEHLVHIAAEFPWRSLKHVWLGNDGMHTTIGVLGLVYSKSGTLLARFSDAPCYFTGSKPWNWCDHCLRDELWTEYNVMPNDYMTQIGLPAGDYDLKVVVTDGAKFGRVEVPLKVESYNRNSLAISGVVLCKRYHAPLPRAKQYSRLVSKNIEYTPAGDTRFKKQEPVLAYFQVNEPLIGKAGAPSVQFQIRVIDAGSGDVKTDSGLRPAESWVKPGNPIIPIAEGIKIDSLPSGTYRLEVQASDSAGNHTDWRATSFTVE